TGPKIRSRPSRRSRSKVDQPSGGRPGSCKGAWAAQEAQGSSTSEGVREPTVLGRASKTAAPTAAAANIKSAGRRSQAPRVQAGSELLSMAESQTSPSSAARLEGSALGDQSQLLIEQFRADGAEPAAADDALAVDKIQRGGEPNQVLAIGDPA